MPLPLRLPLENLLQWGVGVAEDGVDVVAVLGRDAKGYVIAGAPEPRHRRLVVVPERGSSVTMVQVTMVHDVNLNQSEPLLIICEHYVWDAHRPGPATRKPISSKGD